MTDDIPWDTPGPKTFLVYLPARPRCGEDESLRDLLYERSPRSPVELADATKRTVEDVIGELRRRSTVFESCAPDTGTHWWFRLTAEARAARLYDLTGERPRKRRRALAAVADGASLLDRALHLLERMHMQGGGGARADWIASQMGADAGMLVEDMSADQRFDRVCAGTEVWWWSRAGMARSNAGEV